MKKHFTLLLFLILFTVGVRAQSGYFNFPTNCWQQKGVWQWDWTANFKVQQNTVTYIKDTIVCGRTWKKCYGEFSRRYSYFRNENGKVYVCGEQTWPDHPTCPDTSVLLFDFTLSAGNTFYFAYRYFTDTVVTASYQNIGGQQRKVITFKNDTFNKWIDGVGDAYKGVLYAQQSFEGETYLIVCQHDSSGTVYYSPSSKQPFNNDPTGHLHICDSIKGIKPCTISLGVEDVASFNKTMNVQPNPCSTCRITGVENVNDIVVMDMVGRKVRAPLLTSPQGEEVTQLDMSRQHAGIYFVRNNRTGQVVKVMVE